MAVDERAGAHHEDASSAVGRHGWWRRPARRNHRRALLAGAVVALAVAAATGLAFSRPETTVSRAGYEQTGRLSYTASVGRSSIYGPAGLSSGQPVYSVAVKNLHVAFRYRLQSARPVSVSGTERLVAEMSNGQGVVRTIPLVHKTAFRGGQFVATAVLPIATLKHLASVFEGAVGAQLNASSYSVTFKPTVVVTGKLAGAPLLASFHPSIPFTYTGGVLAPSLSGGPTNYLGAPAPASHAAAPKPRPQLSSTKAGTVQLGGSHAVDLFGSLTVAHARLVSLVALALFLALALLAGRSFARARATREERDRIASRHRAVLVPVATFPAAPEVTIVEIDSFPGLLRIARRLECPILSESGPGPGAYAVVDNGTVYRYRSRPLPAGDEAARAPAAEPADVVREGFGARVDRSTPSMPVPVWRAERA